MPTIRERNGRYQAQVRIKQDGRVVFHASETFDTRKQAETWGKALETKVDRATPQSYAADTLPLAKLMDMHEKLLLDAGKGLLGVRHVLKTFREDPVLANRPVGSLQSSDIAEFAMRHSKGRAKGTVLHALMILRSAYRTAITMHDLPLDLNVVVNATKQMTRMGFAAKSQERDRRVTDEELELIVSKHESLMGTTIPLRLITSLAVALPRRREELLTMRWEHYNGEQIKLMDTKDPNKTRDEIIPVPPLARAIIDQLPYKTEGIMLPYKPSGVSKAFMTTAARVGITDIHFHDLRHEGISRLFAAGLNIPEVSLISGHTSWATLKRYTHLKPSDVLEKLRAGTQANQKAPA